jgi:hypothetical protein
VVAAAAVVAELGAGLVLRPAGRQQLSRISRLCENHRPYSVEQVMLECNLVITLMPMSRVKGHRQQQQQQQHLLICESG